MLDNSNSSKLIEISKERDEYKIKLHELMNQNTQIHN